MMTWFTPCSWPPEEDTPGNSWWGCASRFSKSWPYFRPKKCYFPHPFSDQISKVHTHFQTWPKLACSRLSDSRGDSPVSSRFIFMFALSQFSGPNDLGAWNRLGLIRQKLCHHYQIRARLYISVSFLFISNWNNKYVHIHVRSTVCSRSSLESRPKWAKCSQTKKAQKPYSLGWHIPIWFI